MPRVVHFEFAADDPERASRFYREVFGWNIAKWEGPMDYWLISTGDPSTPGIDGGMMRRSNEYPSIVNTIQVPSVDAFVDKVVSAGGEVVAPKMPIPEVGYLAYCKDTEGNVFGIMESDSSAA